MHLGISVRRGGLIAARRGIQHLGIDARDLDFLYPRRGIPPAGADLVEAHPVLTQPRILPRAGVEPDRHRPGHPLDDPGIALLESLHPWHTVTPLRRDPRRPQISRFVDMAVGRDQVVDALAARL